MTDIRFYHLHTKSLDQALPALLQKAYASHNRIVVRLQNAEEVQRMNEHLWTVTPETFLPHGTDKEGNASYQPIYLTDKEENPNEAKILILSQGVETDTVDQYEMCCEVFDGRIDAQVQAARKRWKIYKEAGHEVTYWKQTDQGGWEKKA